MGERRLENSAQLSDARPASERIAKSARGECNTSQLIDNRPESHAQKTMQAMADCSPQVRKVAQFKTMIDNRVHQQPQVVQKKENKTGLPDTLKSGIESLSGVGMDDVRVHSNSCRPAQLNALAFAQGREIHLGPGQEKHLPHEAWHVVQQKQGRVDSTVQMAGIPVNDDPTLEREADIMGGKAAVGSVALTPDGGHAPTLSPIVGTPTLQGLFGMEKESRVAIKGATSGVIAKGGGFSVEPDNGNGGKILEFITDPFDEHTTKESVAIDAFTRQLNTIWSMMEEIKALEDDASVDEVFEKYGLTVKKSIKRRVHGSDSFKGPVHFTVGMKLEEVGTQFAEIQRLSTKRKKSATQDARMDHVARSAQFQHAIATSAAKTYGSSAVTNALSGYFGLAFLTMAGWQSSLHLEDDGLKKQIPLALLKLYPSAVLAGIAQDAQKKEQPNVLEWVSTNAEAIQSCVVSFLPLGDAGKKSLKRWLKWLVGTDDTAISMLDEQMTMIDEKESLGPASAIPYGYAAELRNINIGDQSSMGSVREAGIEVIRMSRGGVKEGVSEKDRSYSDIDSY